MITYHNLMQEINCRWSYIQILLQMAAHSSEKENKKPEKTNGNRNTGIPSIRSNSFSRDHHIRKNLGITKLRFRREKDGKAERGRVIRDWPLFRALTREETASQTRRTGKIILCQSSINRCLTLILLRLRLFFFLQYQNPPPPAPPSRTAMVRSPARPENLLSPWVLPQLFGSEIAMRRFMKLKRETERNELKDINK